MAWMFLERNACEAQWDLWMSQQTNEENVVLTDQWTWPLWQKKKNVFGAKSIFSAATRPLAKTSTLIDGPPPFKVNRLVLVANFSIFLLRYLWKRREVVLEQTVVQAWWDLWFLPPPSHHQSSHKSCYHPPLGKCPPPPYGCHLPNVTATHSNLSPPADVNPPTHPTPFTTMVAAKYLGLFGQISGCFLLLSAQSLDNFLRQAGTKRFVFPLSSSLGTNKKKVCLNNSFCSTTRFAFWWQSRESEMNLVQDVRAKCSWFWHGVFPQAMSFAGVIGKTGQTLPFK